MLGKETAILQVAALDSILHTDQTILPSNSKQWVRPKQSQGAGILVLAVPDLLQRGRVDVCISGFDEEPERKSRIVGVAWIKSTRC